MNCILILLYAVKVLIVTLKPVWTDAEHLIQNKFLHGIVSQGTSKEF